MHFKNPSVASIDDYSLLALKARKDAKIYFHADFIKPGKSNYIIEHKPVVAGSDGSIVIRAFDS